MFDPFTSFTMTVELDHPNAIAPTRAKPGDAGLDLYTPEAFTIPPRGDKLVPLGIRVEFPRGFALIVKEKSGVATKKKADVGACVVDADYRGIVHVHLFNNSDEEISFAAGEKVAQAIVVPVWDGEPFVGTVDRDTERGEGGFGSTGVFVDQPAVM